LNPHLDPPSKVSLEQYRALGKKGRGMPGRELSASEITQTALLLLKAQRITAWRQTNLTVRKRKGIVNKGVGDILGYTNNGIMARFVACEVKKIGDTLSDAQKEFLAAVHKANGLSLIATQVGSQVKLIPFDEYVKK
jgi:hypothetical protein